MLSFPVEPILTAECNYAGSAALAWSDVSPAKRFAQLIEESRCMSGNRSADGIYMFLRCEIMQASFGFCYR